MQQWKKKQRALLQEQRASLSTAERNDIQAAVMQTIKEYLVKQPISIIGIYWPIKGELDCRELAAALIDDGWQVAVPVINKETKTLDFALWAPDTEMTMGVWNIPIPVQPTWVHPSYFLVPLVGFDEKHYRLGYGAGYYDRTFATINKPVKKIGIGFESARLETIFPHQFDIAMDIIVTEDGLHVRNDGF